MIGNLRAAHAHRYELPLHSAPVCLPYQPVPMDPYALGLILGDGSIAGVATPTFSTQDWELAYALQVSLPGIEVRPKKGYDYVLNRAASPGDVITIENPVTGVARRLGLWGSKSGTKFVPGIFLYNN